MWPSDTPGGTVHSACISLQFRRGALVNNPGPSALRGSLAAPPCCVQGPEAGTPPLGPPRGRGRGMPSRAPTQRSWSREASLFLWGLSPRMRMTPGRSCDRQETRNGRGIPAQTHAVSRGCSPEGGCLDWSGRRLLRVTTWPPSGPLRTLLPLGVGRTPSAPFPGPRDTMSWMPLEGSVTRRRPQQVPLLPGIP